MRRNALASFSLLSIFVLCIPAAHAGLWQDIYRGLDLAATPTGSPVFSTSDGTRVNGSRSGRVRIVPNGVFDKGYRIEFDRTFGADSHGRPETLYLGSAGVLTLQGSTQMTAGYTKLGDKAFAGNANVNVNNLAYDLRTKLGVQDAELFGTLNLTGNLELNALGFYDLVLNGSQTNSQLKLDGVVIRDDKDTNFDIGPVVVSGNIFFDALLGMLTSLGVDTSQLETIFPKSPINLIDDAISEDMQSTLVAGETVKTDAAPLLLRTIFAQDGAAAQELVAGLAEGTLGGTSTDQVASQSAQSAPSLVPEPGTLLLMIVGSAVAWSRKRRR